MNGYDFITAVDDKKWGTVVDQQGDYVIVEHGTLRKHRYAVPKSSVDVDEGAEEVRTTLSGELISESPKVDDDFDRVTADRHYGLAGTEVAPPTEGHGDTVSDDPARGAEYQEQQAGVEPAVQERARIREGSAETNDGMPDESPALLGDRLSDVPEEER
ncbi:MAG: hypothetical protein ACRDMK_09040 [Gaiellaceae bacterium]